MIEAELSKIIIDENKDGQIIFLKDKNSQRGFPIVIGMFEALAIDTKVRELKVSRPLTHDLLFHLIRKLEAELVRIEITKLEDDTFFAELVVENEKGEEVRVDARPSDAIALAVRTGAPIFIDESVMEKADISPQ